MNRKYISWLIETNRCGKLIKLMNDNFYSWSVNDYNYISSIILNAKMYHVYKYMLLVSPNLKKIINDTNKRNFFHTLTYHSYTYKDEDYDKMFQYRYIINDMNVTYDDVRYMNEYLDPFQNGYAYFELCAKTMRFICSHKYLNRLKTIDYYINIRKDLKTLIANAFQENVVYCDDSLFIGLKDNIYNKTPRPIENIIHTLIRKKRFGHVVKIVNKYKSLLSLETLVTLLKNEILCDYMINFSNIKCIKVLCDNIYLCKNKHYDMYSLKYNYKKYMDTTNDDFRNIRFYILHSKFIFYFVQPKLINTICLESIKKIIKGLYSSLDRCRFYRHNEYDNSSAVDKIKHSIPDMKTYNTLRDMLYIDEAKRHICKDSIMYSNVLDLAYMFIKDCKN